MIQLVELQCKKCGGLLSVSSDSTVVCPFCGTSYIIDNTEHISSDVDEEIQNAEFIMMQFGEYDKAYRRFLALTESNPRDYRGYLGLLKVITRCFTDVDCNRAEYEKYSEKLLKTCPQESLEFYRSIIDSFKDRMDEKQRIMDEKRHHDMEAHDKKIRLEKQISDTKWRLKALKETIDTNSIIVRKTKRSRKITVILSILSVIFYITALIGDNMAQGEVSIQEYAWGSSIRSICVFIFLILAISAVIGIFYSVRPIAKKQRILDDTQKEYDDLQKQLRDLEEQLKNV